MTEQTMRIHYTNWRGETAEREIIPVKVWFGSTEWHPEPQWFLAAIDVEKDAPRDFAMKDILQPPATVAQREALPQRRAADTFEFNHINTSWMSFKYRATIGFYDDGRPGEVFLSAAKLTTDMDIAARDSAILLSYALQHRADPHSIRTSMTRDPDGRPMGVIGTLLDIMCADNQPDKE